MSDEPTPEQPHIWKSDADGNPIIRWGSMALGVHEERIDCEVCGESFCVHCGPSWGCDGGDGE